MNSLTRPPIHLSLPRTDRSSLNRLATHKYRTTCKSGQPSSGGSGKRKARARRPGATSCNLQALRATRELKFHPSSPLERSRLSLMICAQCRALRGAKDKPSTPILGHTQLASRYSQWGSDYCRERGDDTHLETICERCSLRSIRFQLNDQGTQALALANACLLKLDILCRILL